HPTASPRTEAWGCWSAEEWPVRAIRGFRGPAIEKPKEVSMIIPDRVAKRSVMKALLCTRLGPPESLVLTEGLPSPKPSAGEVKLQVLVAGIKLPRPPIIEGEKQVKTAGPLPPGGG